MEINWEKKYNEALERARALREEAIEKEYVNDYVKDYEAIFPELAESEEERVREELIGHCKDLVRMNQDDKVMLSIYEPWLAWLEKQKEQKPLPGFDDLTPDEKMNHPLYLEGFDVGRKVGQIEAGQKPEWSEEDSRKIGTLSSIIADYAFLKDALDENNDLTGEYAELDDWLGTFPERFNLPPKQEWGEGDEKILVAISKALGCDTAEKILVNEGVTLVMAAGFLESLKNRGNSLKSNTNSPWKPSEEQIDWLLSAVRLSVDKPRIHGIIVSLYEQLRRLYDSKN